LEEHLKQLVWDVGVTLDISREVNMDGQVFFDQVPKFPCSVLFINGRFALIVRPKGHSSGQLQYERVGLCVISPGLASPVAEAYRSVVLV
jgi:hypothetical protein